MNSQTSLVAEQCRIQTWAMQIKECQNRPKNMTVDEWCLQNNITKANYYYRLRRVRQACLDSMESTSAFIELQEPEIKSVNKCTASSSPAATILGKNGLCIELHEDASADFLIKLIGACTYAQ